MAKSQKGGSFERELAKTVSLWISEGEDDSWVWRTSQSGGRATQRAKKGDKTSGSYGDLTFTDKRAAWFFSIFSLELKCGYEKAEISSLIDSNQKEALLQTFWKQCSRDRELSGSKYSMVILKRDRKHPLVMISYEAWCVLVGLFGSGITTRITYFSNEESLTIIRFNDLFEWMNPAPLKLLFEKG